MTQTFNTPLIEFKTKAFKTSPSTSSATITNGRPSLAQTSSIGKSSFIDDITWLARRIAGLSSSHTNLSLLVTK